MSGSKSGSTVEDNALVETKQPRLLVRRSKLDKLSLAKVTEVYANAATHKLAAKCLGISVVYWEKIRNGEIALEGVDYTDLLCAIEKGEAEVGMKINTNLIKQSKKQVLAAMFLAQQEHLSDMSNVSKQKVEHSGTVLIKFEETTSGEVIDITPDDE